eukprot:9132008-Alexandrium_andersonii.AAC.1
MTYAVTSILGPRKDRPTHPHSRHKLCFYLPRDRATTACLASAWPCRRKQPLRPFTRWCPQLRRRPLRALSV